MFFTIPTTFPTEPDTAPVSFPPGPFVHISAIPAPRSAKDGAIFPFKSEKGRIIAFPRFLRTFPVDFKESAAPFALLGSFPMDEVIPSTIPSKPSVAVFTFQFLFRIRITPELIRQLQLPFSRDSTVDHCSSPLAHWLIGKYYQ